MIPLRDENPAGSAPVVTRVLIALNVAVFLYELSLGLHLTDFATQWAMVPLRLTRAVRLGAEPVLLPGVTLLTSMFMHGGWAHLLGNMWYLWIFGDNVEDRLGRARYLVFYLGSGIAAGLAHYAMNPTSQAPTLGASGAIAAVLGAYAVTWPRARVLTLIPLFPIFVQVVRLPAVVLLGFWFVFQFLSGAVSLGAKAAGGVAWWAHIGGFAFGAAIMLAIGRRGRRSRAVVA